MGSKVLWLSVALIPYLMICEHVGAQCTQPSFTSRNVTLSDSYLSTQSFPDGSTVTFECVIGHRPVTSRASKSVTCESNQWTSLELECTKKKCGSLPDFDNGYYERSGNLFGDNVKAVCNKGYFLDGQTEYRWCRDQGWDGRDPVCEVVKCEEPPAIGNGQLVDEPLDSYDYGNAVSYRCNNGFSLIGSSTLHCAEDGTFKPDPPKCMDGCPTPEISHATRIGGRSPPYKLGNFIEYKCADGFTMKGEYHIVCGSTGWNPEPPKCIALTSTTTTTTATMVTSKAQPKDIALTSTTTTTTATMVTSKAQPKDIDSTGSTLSTAAKVFIGLGVVAVLAIIIGSFIYIKKRSKHVYSEKVATKAQEGEL
ncbi:regulator of complement activation group 2 gene 1 isoform X2 [Pimephales promelas]|uniref:regulator of complement activation group 2 gene 1 isoform X2 n=1 Tax=Pimephales promelas TaxID=90988 RepID=UPI001955DD5C|nr:regulator of complement activation group 2 gene 1 isoform X2 [Pimephales promelas]